MADETFHVPEQNIEYHIVRLLEKLEGLRCEGGTLSNGGGPGSVNLETRVELRSLELWRAVICECLAAFFYVVIVCGAAGAVGSAATPALVLLASALASGLAAATLTHCFRHISGAHLNPAVTIALALTRQVSPLRAGLFVAAHCGGGIAGAALLYGLTVPGYQGNLQMSMLQPIALAAWERFGIEFILTFMVVLTHCVSMERSRISFGSPSSPALAVGAVYGACTLVSMPSLNPARALGPSFVLNRWDQQWVVWAGPLLGGAAGALLHTLVLGGRRSGGSGNAPDSPDPDSSSVQSDEDAYDRLDKPHSTKLHAHHPHHPHSAAYSTYRPAANHHATGLGGYCPTLTGGGLYTGGAAAAAKLERVESLYGGTRSLYCRSPPLTRANLHRSQSVYSKPPRATTAGAPASALPPPGPLLPARSLYQPRIDHQILAHNQNAQNQIQARESTYGTRQTTASVNRETSTSTYGTRQNPTGAPGVTNNADGREEGSKLTRRPESMYGMVVSQPRRNQSAQSDDSSYGSYRGAQPPNAVQNGVAGSAVANFHHHLPPPSSHQY